MKHLSGAPLCSGLLALHTNTRLGWKSLQGTNALAYYENSKLTAVKSIITSASGVNKNHCCKIESKNKLQLKKNFGPSQIYDCSVLNARAGFDYCPSGYTIRLITAVIVAKS